MAASGFEVSEAREMRDVPMMRTPDGASNIGVPEIVMPGPPGMSVVPAMTTSSEFALKV